MNIDYCWYKLSCAKGVGPKTMHRVYETLNHSSVELMDCFDMANAKVKLGLSEKLYQSIVNVDETICQATYDELKRKTVELVHLADNSYPKSVRQHLGSSSPPILYCGGNKSLLRTDGIAIIGSRNASIELLSLTNRIASDLANDGKNVISGYAKGVDTEAHLGALRADGTTTFVLSYGILEFSRKKAFSNVPWTGNILAISQFSPNEKWHARNAMTRNRLVVSLSNGVIVIAAGEEKDFNGKMSGTFDAAKTALMMNVPLFVLSPSLLGNKHVGNTSLIEMGGIEITRDNVIPSINSKLSQEKKISIQSSLFDTLTA